MSKPIYIYKISRNYTRCEVWHGSRTFHNRLGTSILTPDKGLTRNERYKIIAKWLHEQFDLLSPSYRRTNKENRLAKSPSATE